MFAEVKKQIELEIAHILFIDIVGYSKRSINEQRAAIGELNEAIRTSEQFQKAGAADRLIKIATGDGMALVFYTSPEAPAQCAIEISRTLKEHPHLQLRMGVHSGPVSGVIDVTGRANLAGAGLNMANRVMSCGDARHILVSKRIAEDLGEYEHWRPFLHDLGSCEVKHGTRVHVVNLYTDEVGNPEAPEKFHVPTSNFFSELKRRNVYKVAVAYIVAGWALSQGIAQVFPVFDVPNWVIRSIVLLIILGLPIALVLAWMFELTPEGLKRTEDVNFAAQARAKSYAWLYVVVIGGVVSIGLFFLGRYTAPSQTAAGSSTEKSIAVLPFENLSRDPDNAYFATGIQDEILTRIAKIGALKVISRVSTRQYSSRPDNLSEIAHQLGVANVLEGSVQKVANQVHINVQLIRAATDEHLWAESYDRKLENIFGVEGEVATAVAEALKAKLTGTEQRILEEKLTNNPEAYEAYLRAVALWADSSTMDEVYEAIAALDDAVRLDPNFATAWAVLAQIHSMNYFWVDMTPTRRTASQKSLENAMRLRPDSPDVQLAQAYYQFWVRRDFDGARRSLELLQTTWPNNSDIALTLEQVVIHQGQWDKGRAYINRAIELNPLIAGFAWKLRGLYIEQRAIFRTL
jgi:TolB-like protein/class 3 adenylate cyclase